jgi:hypothetical protein
MKRLVSAVLAALLALGTIAGHADTRSAEDQVSFRIESQTLADALDLWARQTGYKMFVPNWDLAKRLPSPVLRGSFKPRAALEKLLQGSPLTWVLLDERSVLVREKPRPAPQETAERVALPKQPS